MRRRLANAGNHLVRADLAFIERLELREQTRSASTAAASGKGCDGVHAGIFGNNFCEGAHFLGHGREGKVLIALNEACNPAGVLLREKTLRGDDEEVDV